MKNPLGELTETLSAPEKLFAMQQFGLVQSRLVNTAAVLEIADHLADGPVSTEQLAELTGTRPDPLFRVLRSLVSLGIFSQPEPGVFENNDMSHYLRKDVEGSQWAVVRQGEVGWPFFTALSEIMRTLKTGNPSVEELWGHNLWEHYRHHPEQRKVFNRSMMSYTTAQTPPVTRAYNWAQFSSICDVGGGVGYQLVNILDTCPDLQGMVFDLPDVICDLLSHERMQGQAGSFFEAVPSGFDAYMLRSILHDWNDEESLKILKSVVASCTKNSTIIVVDMVLPETDEFHFGKMLDISMMLLVGGKERTRSQFAELFDKAGLELLEIIPTTSHFSLVTGCLKK